MKSFTIPVEITPDEDGVHCGDCNEAFGGICLRGYLTDGSLNLKCDGEDTVRPEECLEAEQE